MEKTTAIRLNKNGTPRKIVRTGPGISPSADKLNAKGVEQICLDIASGISFNQMSKQLDISMGSLLAWVEADPDRSARIRAARAQSAKFWDEKAEEEIRAAKDPLEMVKARELAHHFRWRAKVVAPREYGDKVTQEHTGSGGGPVSVAAVNMKGLSDTELEQMQRLLSKTTEANK